MDNAALRAQLQRALFQIGELSESVRAARNREQLAIADNREQIGVYQALLANMQRTVARLEGELRQQTEENRLLSRQLEETREQLAQLLAESAENQRGN